MIQSVGAAWLMTELTGSHLLIALVQASATIPIMLLGIFAGAIADNFDRRRVMLAAQKPPFVAEGDEISSSTFWHGKLNDAWANEWVSYFTSGKGQFVTTAMEDTGTLQSLKLLVASGRADWSRILILRTVSNYDQQPRGMTAADSLAHQRIGTYSAYLPSLEAAYRVGHTVVAALLRQWPDYPVAASSKLNPSSK